MRNFKIIFLILGFSVSVILIKSGFGNILSLPFTIGLIYLFYNNSYLDYILVAIFLILIDYITLERISISSLFFFFSFFVFSVLIYLLPENRRSMYISVLISNTLYYVLTVIFINGGYFTLQSAILSIVMTIILFVIFQYVNKRELKKIKV